MQLANALLLCLFALIVWKIVFPPAGGTNIGSIFGHWLDEKVEPKRRAKATKLGILPEYEMGLVEYADWPDRSSRALWRAMAPRGISVADNLRKPT